LLHLVSLCLLEERSADMLVLAAPIGLLAEAKGELAPGVRAAFAALHEALRSESGAVGTLVLTAAAALDASLCPDDFGPDDN
jgi:hypothetical protein